jgi:uncharacterized membrane protein YbjE (DUF340 family)
MFSTCANDWDDFPQSCTLNATLLSGNASASAANGTSATSMNMTLPIFSTASQQVANIISEQFGYVATLA